jgi:hypothetical protein
MDEWSRPTAGVLLATSTYNPNNFCNAPIPTFTVWENSGTKMSIKCNLANSESISFFFVRFYLIEGNQAG